jgi:hypothetical protein
VESQSRYGSTFALQCELENSAQAHASGGLSRITSQIHTAVGSRTTHSGKDLSMFESFERVRVETKGASINAVRGGEGPPVLLLHGNSQTLAMWHLIAPRLA